MKIMTAAWTRGFSLLEVVLSLAVVGVLGVLAAPSFQGFINEHRLASAMGALAADLKFARIEAIRRNGRVLVCARAPDATLCASQPDWRHGWIVCYAANRDDQCDTSSPANANPIRLTNALDPQLRLVGSASVIRFNRLGTSNAAATVTLSSGLAPSSTRTASVATSGAVTTRKN